MFRIRNCPQETSQIFDVRATSEKLEERSIPLMESIGNVLKLLLIAQVQFKSEILIRYRFVILRDFLTNFASEIFKDKNPCQVL